LILTALKLIRGSLTESNVPAEKAEKFGELYGMAKPELKKVVATTGFIFPRVVDVDWRMDYYVKSNSIEKANEVRHTSISSLHLCHNSFYLTLAHCFLL